MATSDAKAVVIVSSTRQTSKSASAKGSEKDKIFVQPLLHNTTVQEAAAAIAAQVEAEGRDAEVIILSEHMKTDKPDPDLVYGSELPDDPEE